MNPTPPPTAEMQVEFLQKIQRIFDKGDFSATYKYALLMALAQLAVEKGHDDGEPLSLRVRWIAGKFADFYWPQAAPLASANLAAEQAVLYQNLGQQAAVVNAITEFREIHRVRTVAEARALDAWGQLEGAIASVVRAQPLNFLQNVDGSTDQFLYDFGREPGWITLLPGVTFCLRRFQGLINDFARSGWMDHVRANSRNALIIGASVDLESFMFGTPRAGLGQARELLTRLQSNRCFYCGTALHAMGEVDHFVPWSRYSQDLAHNFVLAHSACNRSKSDLLAAERHVVAWLKRNDIHGAEIEGGLQGFFADADRSRAVARWAYQQSRDIEARAWIRGSEFEPIQDSCVALLV